MSEVPEMVERVARAIAADEGFDWNDPLRIELATGGYLSGDPMQNEEWRGSWRMCARAAIKAMREETDAMADAGAYTITGDARGGLSLVFDPTPVWRAMIDAALGKQP